MPSDYGAIQLFSFAFFFPPLYDSVATLSEFPIARESLHNSEKQCLFPSHSFRN